MSFLQNFPDIEYKVGRFNVKIPDIFRSASINNRFVDDASFYQIYNIGEQRPDQLSTELYNSPNFHWTFFIINPELRQGWPLGFESFNKYLDGAYPGIAITPYRSETNIGVGGVNIGADEIEYNLIANRFAVGSVLTGIGRPEINLSGDPISAISPSGAQAIVRTKIPETNTLILDYVGDVEFTLGEELESRAANSEVEYIRDKYHLVSERLTPIKHRNSEGDFITNNRNVDFSELGYTILDREEELNESRKQIRVIRPTYINAFVSSFRDTINGRR